MGTFDLAVLKVILGSFDALVSKWSVDGHRARQIQIWDSGASRANIN